MGKNYFTAEQIEKLRDNPYVKNISEKSITYTEEFREQFYIRYQSDPYPSKILLEMGLDPAILGPSRVHNITKRVKKSSVQISRI